MGWNNVFFKIVVMRSTILLVFSYPVILLGQNQAVEMPTLPTGFSRGAAIATATRKGVDSDRGLNVTLGLSTLYDSNVTLASEGEESDLRYTPRIEAEYLLGNSRWKLGARGSFDYNAYQNLDEYNGTSYRLGVFGGYQSKKLGASFKAGISSTEGFNRWSNDFIEQFSFNSGLIVNYRFSGKTSLRASWDQRLSEGQSEGYGDTSSVTAGLAAIWKATPLISIGPGFRYGVRTGTDDGELTVVGPNLRLDYKLSTKVKVRSTIGIDYSDSPYSGDDTLPNWSLGLNYRASALWGFDLKAIQDTQATLSTGGGFDEITSYRLSYWRKIRRARLELGVSYEDRNPIDSQISEVGYRDAHYFTLSAELALPVFRNQANLTFRVQWRDQEATDDDYSWDGVQTGLGLAWQF